MGPIDPATLYRLLQRVDRPYRYTGGEFGTARGVGEAPFRVAIAFPDLYEIGMSNSAIKILYRRLNAIDGVTCERVFMPDYDLAEELRRQSIPLFSLESATPLAAFDLIAISFAYELLGTNVLGLLDLGHIPIRTDLRSASDPLVLFGGSGITNPAPWDAFCDGHFIGEAEDIFDRLVVDLAQRKRNGGTRQDLVELLHDSPHVWFHGRTTGVTRAVWDGFASGREPHTGAAIPVPSAPIVQDHGVVEVMRGCPQGCRFCHAGFTTRPYRMRSVEEIESEVAWLVDELGYREVTLSSLSSGDYDPLPDLLQRLNARYNGRGVSFQVPSLRVNSVTLPLIDGLSKLRRSALTFAVETAADDAQCAMNKRVPLDRAIRLIGRAHEMGWRRAKLYFMVGLPGVEHEAESILRYLEALRAAVRIEYAVNVATFVPKPHTPFERVAQAPEAYARDQIAHLRASVPRGVSIRPHDPAVSWLEGVLARGDERIAESIERAYRAGALFDAWDDRVNIALWRSVLTEGDGKGVHLDGFSDDEALPWAGVSTGVPERVRTLEASRALAHRLRARCAPGCSDTCGGCDGHTLVHRGRYALQPYGPGATDDPMEAAPSVIVQSDQSLRTFRLVLRFARNASAAWLPHLGLVRTFERIWLRLGVPLRLTEGYHPKARMSFAQPLPIGTESSDDIVAVDLSAKIHLENLSQGFDDASPEGFRFRSAALVERVARESRVLSPMAATAASVFEIRPMAGDHLPPELDARLREFALEGDGELDGTRRIRLGVDDPGIGRLIPRGEEREVVRIRRSQLLGLSGARLIDEFASHPRCVAFADLDVGRRQ